jgi:23S rRNA (adenine1618-N6)-methyltransferase
MTSHPRQLTQSLLKYDFNLTIELPHDRLCPPVPVRWNYIRWIQDLLDTTSSAHTDHHDPEQPVLGLDIGVGASCIYGLLACTSRPSWKMAGTDIDAHSLEFAKKNVQTNGLSSRIRMRQTSPADPLIPIDALGVEEMDFVMTNPPFYASEEEFLASHNDSHATSSPSLVEERKNEAKPPPPSPSAVCVGAPNEMICSDGDVGFVSRIVAESLVLRERVQWYTAMLSHMHSMQKIVALLKRHGVDNYAVTSLHPGHKTKRYAIGWTFRPLRPRNDVARHGELVLNVLPAATEYTAKVPLMSTRWAGQKVDEIMKGLHAKWMWRPILDAGVMQFRGNVWNRKARSRKKKADEAGQQMKDDVGDDDEEEDVALAVKISCKEEQVDVRWLRGHDHVLFMSFCKFLKDQLTGRHERGADTKS